MRRYYAITAEVATGGLNAPWPGGVLLIPPAGPGVNSQSFAPNINNNNFYLKSIT